MDSGMILDARDEVPFEPLLLLLPEELCWMLDRNFACEVNESFNMTIEFEKKNTNLFTSDGMAFRKYIVSNSVHFLVYPSACGYKSRSNTTWIPTTKGPQATYRARNISAPSRCIWFTEIMRLCLERAF